MYIDVTLGDFDTSELINELEYRPLDTREMNQILELIKGDESQKIQLFVSVMDRFSLFDLQNLFNEDLKIAEIPKEQLSFNF